MSPGLLVLLGLGGAAYFFFRPKAVPLNADMSCPPGYNRGNRWGEEVCLENGGTTYTPGADMSVWPPPDAILAKYQAIIMGHGSELDCRDVLAYIDRLEPETQAEADWIAERRREVRIACDAGPVDVTSPPSLEGYNLPQVLLDNYNNCVAGIGCDATVANAIADALLGYAAQWQGLVDTAPLRNAASFVEQRYGTSGVHVGDCGCAACAEKREQVGEEPCCDDCARGVGSCACAQKIEDERMRVQGRV